VFEQWLGDASRADFLREVYLTRPHAVAQRGVPFVTRLTWETLHRVLPACDPRDLLVVRDGRLWRGADPGSRAEAEALFADGYSLVVRHAERLDAGLAELAEGFAADFGARVAIQLYATPQGRHSFGWHYDAEEVFILQTIGTKRYFVRENTVRPRPLLEAMPRNMEYEKEGSPLLTCPLAPGDWLYIPAGFWHVARATEHSLSISIGVLPPTAMDLFDRLRHAFAESAAWRTRLASDGPYSTLADALRQEAARILGDQRLLDEAIAEVRRQHPAPSPKTAA
jgi:ribosomal protein L16 Arg81 hydroxylase